MKYRAVLNKKHNNMSYETEKPYEFESDNFKSEFGRFERFLEDWSDNNHPKFDYLKQFNTKLRMPLAIREIQLESKFLDDKRGNIKELHKFLYKIVDLWFAYESFFELYQRLHDTTLDERFSKISCWSKNPFRHQFSPKIIDAATDQANTKLSETFYSGANSKPLQQYIHHCADIAKDSQKRRLKKIEAKYGQDLISTELLTITYAIRNNYVHHGETTITNAGLENLNFSFNESQKLKLVKICYNFLAIFTVNIANTLIGKTI